MIKFLIQRRAIKKVIQTVVEKITLQMLTVVTILTHAFDARLGTNYDVREIANI